MYSKKRQVGNIGEEYATRILKKLNFDIIERNYLRKWGEIDIVARGTDKSIHFVEVKTGNKVFKSKVNVSRDTYIPEENVTREKVLKLQRTIDTWISENNYNGEWHLDVMAIEIDGENGVGEYRFLEDVY